MPPLMSKLCYTYWPCTGLQEKEQREEKNGNGVMDLVVEKLSEMSEGKKVNGNMQRRFQL